MNELEIRLREALEELVESAAYFQTPKTTALTADLYHAYQVLADARLAHNMMGMGHGRGSTRHE